MSTHRLDVAELLDRLDERRTARGLSWTQLAHEAGITPALFTRMRRGETPSVDTYLSLVAWLGIAAPYASAHHESATPAPSA
jgi:transcriptional regulator with XRE-family HTH domain